MSDFGSMHRSPEMKQAESASIDSMDENKMMMQMVHALNREMAEMKISSRKEVSELRATVLALEREILCVRTPPSPPISQTDQEGPLSRIADRLEAIKNFSTPSLRPTTASRDFDPTTPVLAPANGSFSPRLSPSSLKSTSRTSLQPVKHVGHRASNSSNRPLPPSCTISATNSLERHESKHGERTKAPFPESCGSRKRMNGDGGRSYFNTVQEIRELNSRYPRDGIGNGKAGKGKEGGWKGLRRKGKKFFGRMGEVGREWLSSER